jgi:hypothetical protein
LVGWLFLAAYFRGEPIEKGRTKLGEAFTWCQVAVLVGLGASGVFYYLDSIYTAEHLFAKFQAIPLVIIIIAAGSFCLLGLQRRRDAIASGEQPWRVPGGSEPSYADRAASL